jgi:hypothetical protein
VRGKGVPEPVNAAGPGDTRPAFRGVMGALQTGRVDRPVAAARREEPQSVADRGANTPAVPRAGAPRAPWSDLSPLCRAPRGSEIWSGDRR